MKKIKHWRDNNTYILLLLYFVLGSKDP